MIPLERGQYLHNQSIQKAFLTPDERTELEQWYREQDEVESQTIRLPEVKGDVEAIRAQITATLEEIEKVVREIQETNAENERLRHEIARLQQQLVKTSSTAA